LHIKQDTFSTVSGVNIDDIFSADYDNYIMYLKMVNSTTSIMSARYRVAGSDNSTSNYSNQRFVSATTTNLGSRTTAQNSLQFYNGNQAAGDHHLFIDIAFPFSSSEKTIHSMKSTSYPAGPEIYLIGGAFNDTTSFTGMSILVNTGTISGYYNVWGYKK
jgi:hypothetical protein